MIFTLYFVDWTMRSGLILKQIMRILYTVLFTVVLLIVTSCMENKQPVIIGHRGAAGYETENSLPSIQKALDLKVDAIEIDVFKLKSGEIVVFHDNNLRRLTGDTADIEDKTLPELNKLRLKNNASIPLLTEVLDLIDNEVRLNIELKGGDTAEPVNKIILNYIQNNGWERDNFIISSFKWDELKKMRVLNNDIPIAVLTDKDPLKAISFAKEMNAEAINPHYKSLTETNVNLLHKEHLKVYPWTVDEAEDIQKMKDLGVDGIISDFPDRIR